LSQWWISGGGGVAKLAELRAEAKRKRHLADVARRAAPGMSLARDRASLLEAARRFEAEASALDARADAIDARARPDNQRDSVIDDGIGPRKR